MAIILTVIIIGWMLFDRSERKKEARQAEEEARNRKYYESWRVNPEVIRFNNLFERKELLSENSECNNSSLKALRFRDADGRIHEIDPFDFDAFDDAMSHRDWTLLMSEES